MNYLQVVIGTLLSIFALIRAFIQIKGYDQLLNQYELMNVLYQKAETKINQISSSLQKSDEQHTYLKELFFIIGKEVHSEISQTHFTCVIYLYFMQYQSPGI